MNILNYLVIIICIYAFICIFMGVYDSYRIISKGPMLVERKKALESLAGIHGYSSSGWMRFEQYQQFMYQNGHVLDLYKDYQISKTRGFLKSIGYSAIMIPIIIVDKIKKDAHKRKARKQKKEKDV